MDIMTPNQLNNILETKSDQMVLLDVRSSGEFASGAIAGSTNIPLDTLDGCCDSLPKDKLIVLSCLSGHRSRIAKDFLASQGFQNLAELEGGFANWHQSGFPAAAGLPA